MKTVREPAAPQTGWPRAQPSVNTDPHRKRAAGASGRLAKEDGKAHRRRIMILLDGLLVGAGDFIAGVLLDQA